MKPISLHDRNEIEVFLRRNVFLNIYSLGDLDDFFWPFTTWYGLKENGALQGVALIYSGGSIPTLLALAEEEKTAPLHRLLRALTPLLPLSFYAHLSLGLQVELKDRYTLIPHGEHYKMALAIQSGLKRIDTSHVIRLSSGDLPDILALLNEAYPENYFDPRMLETNQYYGIRSPEGLISMGGIHVYSPRLRVAALGNIVTRPSHRGKGHASAVTARLCQSLLNEVDHIGLNVQAENRSAIRCYEKLGFDVIACYNEYRIELKRFDSSEVVDST
jgi:RimJ/RimL family protein N-acetyltransferase